MFRIVTILAFIFLIPWNCFAQKTVYTDICIYGGTSSGVIAAYTAKMLGKNVVLIEPGGHLGGMTSGGLGYTDIGNKSAITGLARDFYRRIGKHYGKFEQWVFEPHVAEAVFNDFIRRADVEVIYQSRIEGVNKDILSKITSIAVGQSLDSVHQRIDIHAAMFIDCSYEGDLMAMAGVSYKVGRESNHDYNETINGVQLMDGHQFPDGIDPYKIPGKRRSGLLWGVKADSLKPAGTEDKKIQAYNYRICLTSEPANQVPITQPDDYDPSRYELLLRLMDASPQKRRLNDYFIISKMPNSKTDINNKGGFSSDMIGMNHAYPEASYAQRDSIVKLHENYTKGLLYFIGHDERVPKPLRDEMLMWGYPADEYLGNNHWSHQLYIREARRMIGEYVMTQQNCEGKRKVHDGIGMAAYTMDSHNCQRIVVDGQVKNEGNVEVGGFGPYPISYRAIIPKEEHCTNLLVPVCLSATHIAYGSIRMEPVFMVLGQSAATAAVMAIENQVYIQDVNVKELQHTLIHNPLCDSSVTDVVVDNEDGRHTRVNGKKWIRKDEGGYGKSFLVSDPPEEKKLERNARFKFNTVRFHGPIKAPGRYQVFIYLPKVDACTDQMKVKVSDGRTARERIVNPKNLSVEGQASGEWLSLGQQEIIAGKRPFVEVTNEGATGKVVADAVIWVPVTEEQEL
jgi:hypothetical protein